MHHIQEQLLKLSADRDVAGMKLVELAQIVGEPHLQKIKHHREQLIKKGLLTASEQAKQPKIMRNYLGTSDLLAIPVLGSANAGPATIYADAKVQGYLHVSSSLLPKGTRTSNLFALKVVGHSMNRAKLNKKQAIENGDYVIADGTQPYVPETGDYVVSLIEGMANIKKFVLDGANRQIVLMSESTGDYPPIVIHEDDPVDYLASAKILHVVKSPKLA